MAALVERTRALTARPFGVNFILREDAPPIDRACFELAAGGARVVELFLWAPPDRGLVELVHRGGALVAGQVGSREDAVAAAAAGCDLIVAQGIEAGGHVRGRIGVLALLDEVLAAVDVPVLAAGGIGTGRAVAAALAAGAAGVRVGTRFVAAAEAGVHPRYAEALVRARAQDTVYTEAFSAEWQAPHRVLRACIAAAQAFEGAVVAERTSLDGTRVPARAAVGRGRRPHHERGHRGHGALRGGVGRRGDAGAAGRRDRAGAGRGGRGLAPAVGLSRARSRP